MKILNFFEIFENFVKIVKKFFFFFNFRILQIGKPPPERVLIFPDRQTAGSAGVNFRH